MSTYTQLLYQVVFSTKNREPVLLKNKREHLFKYIGGILQNKKCHLYSINGIEDHIHIITHIHPTIALSNLVKDIKIASSIIIKKQRLFENFSEWQHGYGGFTYDYKEKNRLIDYVKNQEAHHKTKTFKEEYKELLIEHGIEFEERFLF